MRKTQTGVSLMGLITSLILLVIVALFGMKVIPSYLEFATAKSTIEAISRDPGANTPQLVFYRNRQGDAKAGAAPPVLAFRFVGGKRDGVPAAGGERWTPRDGYGAQVRVSLGDATLLREHRCGEGMSSQNSAVLLVGIGDAARAENVEVRWPSGTRQVLDHVAVDQMLVVEESRT